MPSDSVTYHWDTDPAVLEEWIGYPVQGATFWDGFGNCDIYMAPRDQFASEACFEAVLAHEERHCAEGDFHPHTPEGSRVDCPK